MLTREQIIGNLKRLGELLLARGMRGELLLTGGAAMCLVHSVRDMTKDIDALYEPKEIINGLAEQIAEEEGLPAGWLNDSVKGFVEPGAPVEAFRTFEGLTVTVVSARYLMAMKLMSARGGTDTSDISFLMRKLNIQSADEALEIVTSYYQPERVLPKTVYLIEECLQDPDEPEEGAEQANGTVFQL